MQNTIWIYVSLLIVTIIWGGSFSAIKHLLDIYSPAELLLARFLPSAVIFMVITLALFYKDTVNIVKKHYGRLLIIGLLGIPAYHLCLNFGETQISAGLASLIIGLNPTLTFIFSLFLLKEKPNHLKLLGILISFFGLFVLVKYGSGQSLSYKYVLAVFITVLAPASWALYTIASKPLTMKYPPTVVASISSVFGTIPTLFLINKSFIYKTAAMTSGYVISLLFLILLSTVVGAFLWLEAVKRISPVRASSFIYFVPLFAVIIGIVFLGEHINTMMAIGGLFIMGGVWVTNKKFS